MTFLRGEPDEDRSWDGELDPGSSSSSSTSATESDDDPTPVRDASGFDAMDVEAVFADGSSVRDGGVDEGECELSAIERDRPGGVLNRSAVSVGTSVGVAERGVWVDGVLVFGLVGVDVDPGDVRLDDEDGEVELAGEVEGDVDVGDPLTRPVPACRLWWPPLDGLGDPDDAARLSSDVGEVADGPWAVDAGEEAGDLPPFPPDPPARDDGLRPAVVREEGDVDVEASGCKGEVDDEGDAIEQRTQMGRGRRRWR